MTTDRTTLPCICGGLQVSEHIVNGTNHRGQLVDVRSCAGCGLARTHPPPDVTRLESSIYQSQDDFIIRQVHFARTCAYQDSLLSAMRELVAAASPRLLDVGCSVGALLVQARKRGFDVAGIELNALAAAHAREAFGLDVRSCMLDELHAAGERFDLITLTQVVEHLPRPQDVLETAARMLRPGGAIIVEVPNREGLYARLLGTYWPAWSPTQHLWHFTRSTIALLERHGNGYRLESVAARRCIDYHFVPTPLRSLVGLPGLFSLGDNLTAVFRAA